MNELYCSLTSLSSLLSPIRKVLFSMTKDILIDVPAAKKSIDSVERLICKGMINCICKSKLPISNNNTRERDIFGFKNFSNMSYYPSVERLAVVRIYIDESNESSDEDFDGLISPISRINLLSSRNNSIIWRVFRAFADYIDIPAG